MRPYFVAIAGGSCSGKSWLAESLEKRLRGQVALVSLDDFYLDRSHLSPDRRANINFDHPRAIDWPLLKDVLTRLKEGRPAKLPRYDFHNHCRLRERTILKPKQFIVVEGLWLLRSPAVRRLFNFSVFLECTTSTRFQRRLARDRQDRGRTPASIREQFRRTVEPMHCKYVLPQARFAWFRLPEQVGPKHVRNLAKLLKHLNNF
jgi:uridine kinase